MKNAALILMLFCTVACARRESKCEKARDLYLSESMAETDEVIKLASPVDRAVIKEGAERELNESKKNFVAVCMKRVDSELECITKGPKQGKADTTCQAAFWRLSDDLTSTLDSDLKFNALTEPVGAFDVAELVAEFEANEVAAAAKYQGRLVKVTDKVTDIAAAGGGSVLTLGGDKLVAAAKFRRDTAVLFAKKGEAASVQCVLATRIQGLITLTDCELVR